MPPFSDEQAYLNGTVKNSRLSGSECCEADGLAIVVEAGESERTRTSQVFMKHGSCSSSNKRSAIIDGGGESFQNKVHRKREKMERIQMRVERIRQLIEDEQAARDGNLDDYMRLSMRAGNEVQHLRAVLKMKIIKSIERIRVLVKQLNYFQTRLANLEVLDKSCIRLAQESRESTSKASIEVHVERIQSVTGETRVINDDGSLSSTDQVESTEMGRVKRKIQQLMELIRCEQSARDGNVYEYLRMTSQANQQQQARLKGSFERRHIQSGQTIRTLERKLHNYQRRLQDIEAQTEFVQSHRLKGVLSFPKKAKKFFRCFGKKFTSNDDSAATFNVGRSELETVETHCSPRDDVSSLTSLVDCKMDQVNQLEGGAPAVSDDVDVNDASSDRECDGSCITNESTPDDTLNASYYAGNTYRPGIGLESIFQELHQRREEVKQLKEEIDQLKFDSHYEVSCVSASLHDERFRLERLQQELFNLSELHQNEVEIRHQNRAEIEEWLRYELDERFREVHDLLISQIERQTMDERHVILETIRCSKSRSPVLVKLANLVLTLLQLLFVVIGITVEIVSLFIKTRLRIFTTCLFTLVLAFILKQWPDLVDLATHFIQHYKTVLRAPTLCVMPVH